MSAAIRPTATTSASPPPGRARPSSGNTVFDNTVDRHLRAIGSVMVSGNTVYGQTGNATGIAVGRGRRCVGQRRLRQHHRHQREYRRAGERQPRLRQHRQRASRATYGSTTIQGNHVYGNAVGIDLGEFFTGTVSNNVLEGNTTRGDSRPCVALWGTAYLDNNTIDTEGGNGDAGGRWDDQRGTC